MTALPDDDDIQADPHVAAAVAAEMARLREDGQIVYIEPRCKICSDPNLRRLVNKLLALGLTRASVVAALEPLNALRESPISWRNVHDHQTRHFDVGGSAQRVYDDIVRRRAAEAGLEDFEDALGVAVNVKSFYEIMMVKGLSTLMAEETIVSPAEGAVAAAKLYELERKESGSVQVAEIMARQNKIIAAVRDIMPPELIPAFMARLRGQDAPPLDVEVVDSTEVEEFDPGGDEEDD